MMKTDEYPIEKVLKKLHSLRNDDYNYCSDYPHGFKERLWFGEIH
jgi:hypothetical protein